MGLSDQERYAKVAYACDRVMKKWGEIKYKLYESNQKKWQPVVDEFWPAFMAGNGRDHGFCWFLGSSFTKETADEMYLGHLGMIGGVKSGDDDGIEKMQKERLAELKKEGDAVELKKYQDYLDFDNTRDFCKNKFAMSSNLATSHDTSAQEVHWALELWAEMEYTMYGILRYQDKFSDKFLLLQKHIARASGMCFHIFAQSDTCAKSYLLSRLGDKIITYDSEDLLNQLVVNQHLYHKIGSADRYDYQELLGMWKTFQFQQPSLEERTLAFMVLIKREFDKSDLDRILKAVAQWKLPKKKAFLKLLTNVLSKAAKAKEAAKVDDVERWWKQQHCDLTEQSTWNLPYPNKDKKK
jgi:hypothetical protein